MKNKNFDSYYDMNGIEEKRISYKSRDNKEMDISILHSCDIDKTKKYPLVIFFFGGAWCTGSIEHFKPQAIAFAKKGFVAARVDYRVMDRDNTTVETALTDAFYSLKHLGENADNIYADRSNVFLCGLSVGGHLAINSVILNNINNGLDIKGIILYNAVVDTTKTGFMNKAIFEQPFAPVIFSPKHHLRENLPPIIMYNGTADKAMPYNSAVEFYELYKKYGNNAELVTYKDRGHNFFNLSLDNKDSECDYIDTLNRSIEFTEKYIN